MLNTFLYLLASIAWTELADLTAHPRGRRAWTARAFAIRASATLVVAGIILACTGSSALAFAGTALFGVALAAGSNLKRRHLGEPLVFSDLAYIGAAVRHPRLYIGVLPPPIRVVVVLLPLVVTGVVAWVGSADVERHAIGFLIGVAGMAVLAWALRDLPATPDLERDVGCHGLVATMLRYWVCWRRTRLVLPARPALALRRDAAQIVVIVQCESFVDPSDLPGLSARLPGHMPALEAARARASLSGRLLIDGFGAYTMRTEFGVLTGLTDLDLGFRRFDPFVRGADAAPCALATRFAARGYDTQFVHPFELGFYGRDRLMPALGFKSLAGRPAFANAAKDGPYVSDRAVAANLRARVEAASGPTLIYTVTMENHGPWAPPKGETALHAYSRHLANSDAMLADLMDLLDGTERPMLLVFFGDHRPSIPGHVEPDSIRHTPFVILSNRRNAIQGTADLTPAELHHALIRHAAGTASSRGAMSSREAAAASNAPVI